MEKTAFDAAPDGKYCIDKVRLDDASRYLSALYGPDQNRHFIFALYALICEIARIPDLVSEPELGEIRLRWWIEALSNLYSGNTADHPILRELDPAIEAGNLPKPGLMDFVEAHGALLYGAPFASLEDFTRFASRTDAAAIFMACQILAPNHATAARDTADHAGLACALTTRLRRFGIDSSQGKFLLPEDLAEQNSVTREHVLGGRYSPEIRKTFGALLERAADATARSRDQLDRIPVAARTAFLPVTVAGLYQNAMSKRRFNPLRRAPRIAPLRIQWRIMRAARKSAF